VCLGKEKTKETRSLRVVDRLQLKWDKDSAALSYQPSAHAHASRDSNTPSWRAITLRTVDRVPQPQYRSVYYEFALSCRHSHEDTAVVCCTLKVGDLQPIRSTGTECQHLFSLAFGERLPSDPQLCIIIITLLPSFRLDHHCMSVLPAS
jgi:hypothetical protein